MGQSAEKNYFNKLDNCIRTSDLKNISGHFTQFSQLVRTTKSELCESDLGEDTLQIARSVLAMQRIDVEPIERDEADDFTRRAIQEKDWWVYFKQRASKFSVPKNCRPGVVAYVIGGPFSDGTIYLCRPYFEMDVPGQIEVLMHEVRHFDGHRHVTCSRGAAKGRSGACDETIVSKGSYAISVQAGVELSFNKQLTSAQRAVSEAGAIFLMVNRFNKVPKVKAQTNVLLSNSLGEIWKGETENGALTDLSLVGELDQPSRIYSNGSALTVFPLNLEGDAYRVSNDLTGRISAIGSFASKYNSESIPERAKYKSFSYSGTGLIAKGKEIISTCNPDSELNAVVFTPEKISSLITFETSPFNISTSVLGESGSIYVVDCDSSKGQITIKKLKTKMPSFITDSFTVDGIQYALTDTGILAYLDFTLSPSEPKLIPVFEKQPGVVWVSAATVSTFDIFEREKELELANVLAGL